MNGTLDSIADILIEGFEASSLFRRMDASNGQTVSLAAISRS